uniref:hypothetical protein n=1 Tax=Wolbachia endosymbiont (group A) of Anomoia purmunda TaxID=2953978 RepID=UPI00397E7C9E
MLLFLSSQCLKLESSLYYAATWLKLSFLDPSVSYLDDTILFSGSQWALLHSTLYWIDQEKLM